MVLNVQYLIFNLKKKIVDLNREIPVVHFYALIQLSFHHIIQRHVLCWSGAGRGPEEDNEGVWGLHSDHLSEPGQQCAGFL